VNTKFIVNPVAGANKSHKKWQVIIAVLKRLGVRFDYQFTEASGHAIEIARAAAVDGYERIVAVGGDGTVNEVANGILGSSNPSSTLMGVISTGTGSDFIRSAGIPRDYLNACSRLADSHRITVDAGIVECVCKGQKVRRYFINTAGIGLDAAVVDNVQKVPKTFGGTVPYLFGLVRTLFTYQNKNIVLSSDGESAPARVVSVMVANGGFAGGGMHFAPMAKLDDGLLDLVVVGDMGKLELIKSFSKVYKGTHIYLSKVKTAHVSEVTVDTKDKAFVYADGEVLGEGPVSFRVIPSALQVAI
jgi:diacylglycerol kinase (ATP)